MSATEPSGFAGRHMMAILVAFFGVVIAVNVEMARLAIGTFGGEVVENSYVASQHFNRWLDEAAAERALGWSARATRAADNRLAIRLTGVQAAAATLTGVARHPLGRLPDRVLKFDRRQDGTYLSTTALPPGRWRLRLEVLDAGRRWRHEEDVR